MGETENLKKTLQQKLDVGRILIDPPPRKFQSLSVLGKPAALKLRDPPYTLIPMVVSTISVDFPMRKKFKSLSPWKASCIQTVLSSLHVKS